MNIIPALFSGTCQRRECPPLGIPPGVIIAPPPPPLQWMIRSQEISREFSLSHHELTENTSSYVIMPNVCCYLSLSIEGFWNLKFVQIKFSVLTQTGCVRMEMLLGNVTIFTVGYNAFPAMTSYLYLITVNTQNGQVESILKGHIYLRIEQRDKWWRGGGGGNILGLTKKMRENCSGHVKFSAVISIFFQ